MPDPGYRGPVIDAHHHLWDLSDDRYPWLRPDVLVPHRYGDYTAVKHDYRPEDLLRDAAGQHLVATVTMEAEWDPEDPVGETRFLERTASASGVPGAMAAQARLDAEDVAEVLAEQASHPSVRSIRHKPGGPARLEQVGSGRTRMSDPRWRAGYALLATHGLHFELQTPWWNLYEAAELAADHPETLVVVNHAGVLLDHRSETVAGWRDAVTTVAQLPNVVVKASGLCTEDDGWDPVANREVVGTLVSTFGADRVMFGSNFPVDGMFTTYAAMLDGLRSILADLPDADQRAVFHDTADRVYRPARIPEERRP
ncbi:MULTISPECIES: amidohydrolase [unclassified Curtobacterium]|uniref:amidohydrolase family protein n=1 Tax=unclassified Curtobacterium TaxID=257496 RepID=UPI0008DCD659|nr:MULTISPECIES: amidohydrolase family protein [unclassified Curtobacterium]OIH96681.1 thioesterase [Curtobacterium sp. MCBA15_003]OII33321.1 thioesterase [Curtobacterium sp. MMLR14_006]